MHYQKLSMPLTCLRLLYNQVLARYADFLPVHSTCDAYSHTNKEPNLLSYMWQTAEVSDREGQENTQTWPAPLIFATAATPAWVINNHSIQCPRTSTPTQTPQSGGTPCFSLHVNVWLCDARYSQPVKTQLPVLLCLQSAGIIMRGGIYMALPW